MGYGPKSHIRWGICYVDKYRMQHELNLDNITFIVSPLNLAHTH